MNLINDMLYCIKSSLLKSMTSIKKDYKIFALGPMFVLVLTLFNIAMAPLKVVGNIMLLLISCLLMSALIYYVECSVRGRRLSIHDINFAMKTYALRIMGVVFIIYLFNVLISMALKMTVFAGLMAFIMPLLYLVEFMVVGAVPETIYRKTVSDFETILYSAKFTKENPVQWLLPNILVIVGVYKLVEYSFIYGSSSVVLVAGVLSAFLGPFMVFRGFLYEVLDSSTVKKRIFMRNNKR